MAKFITLEKKHALAEQFRRSKKALGELWVYLPLETPPELSKELERLRVWLYDNDPDPTYQIYRDRRGAAERERKSGAGRHQRTRVGDRSVPGQEGESVRPPSED